SAPGGGDPAEPIEVTMPEMGESVTEGTVLEWHVAVGDTVEEGQTLVEVSTDKVDAEVPAPATGEITELLVEPDQEIPIGAALCRMIPGAGSGDAGNGSAPAEADATAAAAPATTEAGDGRATPVAKRVAAAKGLTLGQIAGSGPGGKVTKADVLAAGDGSGAVANREEKALRGPAGMLAKAMDESRSIPTATSFRTVAVDTLDAKRKGLNGALAERGMKVSFTHLVAWAIVRAARKWPVMARHFEEKDGKLFSVSDGQVNLGIAVDVEKKDGSRSLMVPAIKGADQLDFPAFHAYYEDLITKTRENRLTPDDFAGTNITLTNPGGIGTVASVPRLMSGQGTIVAAGSIAYPPEWSHADQEKIEQLGVSKVMTLTSTYDHRIIQGAESGNFLKTLDGLLAGGDEFYELVADDLGVDRTVLTAAQAKAKQAPPLSAAAAPAASAIAEAPSHELLQAVQAATSLLKAYRTHGHLAAHLDPLGAKPKGDPALDPETVHLTPELMAQVPASILRIGVPGETLLEALPRMKAAYTGSIGYQFEHISSHSQRVWLREMVETGAHRKALEQDEQKRLLGRLIDVFEFERFLEKAYLGQKMFSIEGLDSVVTMLDELTTLAARGGAKEVVLGMAHRGRLSVLAHTVRRPAEAIFAEFEGGKRIEDVKAVAAIPHGGTGDVKYHYGHE
ncbi:MAG TPA: 2-oxo acid dehydrogenase subunit E2, partial [Solirubrobacterales bacterium]|nr:2-oxo acid dehydrogenase subunit E2 [Solirubrobacterales bacterium]